MSVLQQHCKAVHPNAYNIMKTYLTTIFLLIFSISYAQWEWQIESPTNMNIINIHFIDTLHGWAVGDCGHIWTTVDGGFSWANDYIDLACEHNLEDVFFADKLTGWSRTAYDLFYTNDGGFTWEKQKFTEHSSPFIYDWCFVDSLNGWILFLDGFGKPKAVQNQDIRFAAGLHLDDLDVWPGLSEGLQRVGLKHVQPLARRKAKLHRGRFGLAAAEQSSDGKQEDGLGP